MFIPDGLLTSDYYKHDVGPDPSYITPDPLASDDCLDVFSPVYQFLPLEPEELNTMNPSEDEPSSGLNGRLRPRKSAIPSPLSIKQIVNKYDGKQAPEKPKRSSTPSKASPSKPEDLCNNSNPSPTPQLLCPYCDRKFGSKQTVSKHIRRLHLSASKLESSIVCLFCNHVETEPSDIIRHMIDSHPNQYFACLDCHTRFPSTKELAEHKLNICEKQKISYRNKLRRKTTKKSQKILDSQEKDDYSGRSFNGIVISCELKPAHIHDEADIEDNITTNLILPPSKNISTSAELEKNAVIVLDDIQWNRRIPSNFSFHNTDADQILSRLGVVHRSPKTGESTKKDWFRAIEDATQKFEKCFDTSFYSKVASNVQENLTKFLDGSFNFNPDADSTIKTRKSKNSVVINTAEGFPILLACEQFSRNNYDGYIPRTIAPKHKWKWDNLETEKPWNPDQIKRDTHANNCIITLVSSLDIWTQLRMRRKFEEKFNITPLEKKTEKQNVTSKELKEILESREIPTTSSQIAQYVSTPLPVTNAQDFPSSLGLTPCVPDYNLKPAVLSGEWVRPRCYVCCACGAQSRDSRALSAHVSSKHPNAQVQHYEIVGESLLKADILKHLYVPPNQNVNRTRPPRGFRDCTKCMKSIAIEDLHQHMLDCAGDTPAVRRKCRYRPFGVRRRRPRLPDNRIRKKMRNDIRSRPTRQKKRLRSKPKIRSEVGDAETIRKMLADLPAKRHRALVNPPNSILRPRRKLDKQRAMMMLKRHASEDLKSKPKPSKSNLRYEQHQQQTSSNIDRYKSVTNRDDEDNQPLKSRLKRVACKITRQKETLNRKAMLKKTKRKVRLPVEKNENEGVEKPLDVSVSCPINVQTDEISIEQTDKRINVNADPQNSREHSSGRGDANNGRRDNQRPGSSGQNGNSRNVLAPAQNVPLKHSIARLTANSETHDKSVQFHHLFLVQQECNNTNEHVPTGQRVLFENEAVVTKLDKPPLHFHQNISLETVQEHNSDTVQDNNLESIQMQSLDAIQKNKLNKPRKGLNDCIAMLKNKLVDTDPNAPAHVSVQCGTDDLLSPDPALLSASSLLSPKVDVVKTTQSCPSAEQPKKSSKKSLARTEQLPKPLPLYHGQYFNHDMYKHANNERQTTQWRPVNYDAIMPRFIDNRPRKETSRRRSVSQHENLYLAQQLLSVTPPNDDMLFTLSSEPYNNSYNFPPRKSPKSYPEQFNVENINFLSKYGKRKVFDKKTIEASNGSLQSCGKIVNSQNRKSVDSCKKSTRTRISSPRKPTETLEKPINIRKDISKNTKVSNEKQRNKSLDSRLNRDLPIIIPEERKNDNYTQIVRRKRNNSVNPEVSLSQFKPVEVQLNPDVSMKTPINVYNELNLNSNTVSIPLAHASTNIESMLSVPLDLSSKTSSVDSNYSSRHDETLLPNLDNYETLDLSNKRRTSMEHSCEDEVVDLRVKHNSEYPRLSAIKLVSLSNSQQELGSITALNLVHQSECVPTDLSLKRKDDDTNLCINLSQKKISIDENEIQDLSKNKAKNILAVETLILDDELPTDLSNKKTVTIEDITLIAKNTNNSDLHSTEDIVNDECNVNVQDEPNDLSKIVISENINDTNKTILIQDNCLTPEKSNKEILENINNEDDTLATSKTNISDISLSQNQKPIYDPTLRIPQYKIRPIGSDPTPKEANESASCITPITTSVESYSVPQTSINSTTQSVCRSNSSSEVNNSMIASIEAQERITYSFTKSTVNTVVSSVTGPLPTYSLLNRGTTPITTFESTRPVYALPNACISMAKVDITTNSLLSIPSTTIMSTAPVYTLAGTTLVTPINYVTLPNSGQPIPYPPPCATYLPEMDSQIMTHHSSPSSANVHEGRTFDNNLFIRDAMFNFDRDQEISRQVVLPKEIMEILNDMPKDHRHHLLQLLLYYLSPLRPVSVLSTQTSLFQNAGPSELAMPVKLSRELAVDASTDTEDIKPLHSLPIIEGQCGVPANLQSNKAVLHAAVRQEDNLQNQIIDLTYDEIIPKIDLDSEENEEKHISAEEIPPSIAPVSNIPKTNNDKTASLRAVRIKAPSERQQLKIAMNPLEPLPCSAVPMVPNNVNHDMQLLQSSDTEISSEIQMYEVSSTQSGKNKLSNTVLTYKATPHPICNNLMKSLSGVVVNEQVKDSQSQLLKPGPVVTRSLDTSFICYETKDHSTVTENISLNIHNMAQVSIASRLKGTDTNSSAISVFKINEPLLTNDLKKIDNDDDSDDNISLAVIVRQKQLNQNKSKVINLDLEINTLKSDVTQVKETKKVISHENIKRKEELPVTDATNIPKNIDESSFSIAKLQSVSGEVKEVKSKQLKKKGKKNHNDSAKKVKIHDKIDLQIIEREIDTNKKSDNACENVKMGHEKTLNLNSKHPFLDQSPILSSEEIQKPNDAEINAANIEYKTDVHVQSVEKNEGRVEYKEENMIVRNSIQNAKLLETTEERIRNNNETPTAGTPVKKQNCSVQQVDSGESLEDNNATVQINKPLSSDVMKLLNEEDSVLPLRRSKRGKSLFTECNEQGLINQDILLGQKTPLTKKQLIFSKLLLDEEKSQHVSIVDDNRIPLEENSSSLQDKLNKSSEVKQKSIKRRKSPHSKKKSKKKKSIDSSDPIISDDEVTKTFAKENSSPKDDGGNKLSAIENFGKSNIEDIETKSGPKDSSTQSQIKLDSDNNNELISDGIKIIEEPNKTLSESSVKRKIEPSINDHLETSTHSSKPKKSKSNNVSDILDNLQIQTVTSDKTSHSASNILPLAARRARSKSVVVKSSGSLLYDPYDIDLEDMGDETEPFRKQRLTLLKTSTSKLTKESQLQTMCTTSENVTNTEPDIDLNDIATKVTANKDCKEVISDSDESSKSDVPLKKYVEEKERKNQLLDKKTIPPNIIEENPLNGDDMKLGRKKLKKNKRSPALLDKVQKEDKDEKEVSEEQRSEQFMESFGFFSERKPRKSNLLATKKISETFHIIANESDDVYMNTKERASKKSSRSETKKVVEEENTTYSEPSDLTKLPAKSDESLSIRSATLYCHLCKKEFQRIDNLVRHQMSLLHASKLSGNALTPGNLAASEDFNCLVIFKEHLDRLRILEHKMKSKKQSKTKFTLPTLQQVLLDVRKAVREKQLARRNLSRDQALFLDCCELLKDSNRGQTEDRNISAPLFPCCPSSYALACTSAKEYDPKSGLSLQFSRYAKCDTNPNLEKKPIIHTSARLSGMANFVPLSSSSKQANSADRYPPPSTSTSSLDTNCKTFARSKPGIIEDIIDDKDDSKSDGDVDSITAQNILESEEVRNLEHDLISGLKEAACKFQPLLSGDKITQKIVQDNCPEVDTDRPVKKDTSKLKNSLETKEKKNLDIIENIDMFEDKFDKIKRKCRSQAAAAKLVQTSIEPTTSFKSRKKSDKKKGKRNSKKHNRNTVLTKGALKGFDSIKVSILTSDIDMSSIVPPIVTSSKKKKKRSSKKKRDRKHSILARKLDSNASIESSQKNIDVYEFLDNEEPEIFELRPSTVMERFRNLKKKKDVQSSTKVIPDCDEALSSDSVSDGDDFVYMSDDYVCSDDETENSLMSCELGNVKGSNEVKKSSSPLKRKDVMEKNAVMGKIFKHNALRSEKKSVKPKEIVKPKANLDQLFDSLLEEEPNSSVLMNDDESSERESCALQKKRVFSPIVLSKYDLKTTNNNESSKNIRSPSPALSSDSAASRRISSLLSQQSSPTRLSSSRLDISSPFDYGPSTSKKFGDLKKSGRISKDCKPTPSKKHDIISENKYELPIPNNIHINENLVASPESDNISYDSYDKSSRDRTFSRKKETVAEYETSFEFKADYYDDDAFSDDAGVARQRARRKCTVGKQNILAETWSSESELDSMPPRPNSAESVVMNVGRKRKGKKRDGQISGGRKGNKHVSVKKQDFESRVSSSNRNTGTSSGVAGTSRSSGGSTAYTQQLSLPGPSGIGPRLRPTTSFWADGNEEPEHVQQHGWIVGDSHKKLVTMLAHAKGRKRNNDDKVRLME